MNAKKKIGAVAAFFDPLKHSWKAFETIALDPTQFREQLKQVFSIQLTDAELGALVFLFDKDGIGFVDTAEFINEFFKLGAIEKQRFNMDRTDKEVQVAKFKKRLAERREDSLKKYKQFTLASTWKPSDEKTSIQKIAGIAFSYDPVKGGLEGFFKYDTFTQVEFKEQIRTSFNVVLTMAETAAIFSMFASEGSGLLDNKEFLYHFFRIGQAERGKHFRVHRDMTREMLEKEQQRLDSIAQRFGKATLTQIKPATEEDRKSAFNKIKNCAMQYKASGFVDYRKCFESTLLEPTPFRELLKRNYEIALTPGELDACISMFDSKGSGCVNCAQFLSTFFKVGVVEKSKFYRRKAKLQMITNDQKLERKRQLLEEAIEKVKTNIVWPRLPADDDSFGGSSTVGFPAIGSGRATTAPSIYTTTLRRARRTPMEDILPPSRDASRDNLLSKGSSHSLADKFPKASQATRDFLAQIEGEELKLKQMRRPRAVQDGPRAMLGASLDDWAFSEDVAEQEGNRYRNLTSTTNPNPASRGGFGDRPDTHAGARLEVASRAGTRGGRRGDDGHSSRAAMADEFGAEVEEEIL